ncbi:Hpt domain-containing protein [Marivivens sp. LCG002]|uniref:Hpt domain-containing protein n=1 Tax=Marivivens sp. LCG002 TaxID=3051171 RepID=UPI002554C2ED|nr:Hpt domain-containing protein [Marivivens sp. LCG002]WIV51302.1 Hpt domain-containing protein [Marivivens sp. LCG002]
MSDEMDEIWALYLDDGTQSLDAMEAALLAIQGDPQGENSEHISALFRAVHTFKGNSRVLGLGVVESRAHYAEDLIGLVRDEGVPMDDEILDILLYAGDVLRGMLEETSTARADVDPAASEDLLDQLKDKIARCREALGGGVPAEQEAVAPEPETVAEAEVEPVETVDDEPQSEVAVSETAEDVPVETEEAIGEEPEAAAVVEDAPEPEPAPEPTPEPKPVAKPSTGAAKRLIDDPTYRDIFTGMANDAVRKLQAIMGAMGPDYAASNTKARKEVDNLHHASGQMGLPRWVEFLGVFLKETPSNTDEDVERIAALVLLIQEAIETDLNGQSQSPVAPKDGNFFDKLEEALAVLSKAGMDWAAGEEPSAELIKANAALVNEAALEEGLVRVAETALNLCKADDAKSYRDAELRMYEELSAVERVLLEDGGVSRVRPSELLRNWCAGHAFDTITALDTILDRFKSGDHSDAAFSGFSRQMRLVFHACGHHKLDTAGQLAMSLIDLFSRVQTSGAGPDSILMHIARGFVDTIELVFDALEQGEIPDTQNLDALFEQASNAAFLSEGLLTATAIERKLNLPLEFHRVLSPDSVRTASAAIEAGQHFYIVRTDINSNDALAEKFFELISSDLVDSITNVTVFRGNETLFDFLLASSLEQGDFVARIAEIDPSGKDVSVLRTLEYNVETVADMKGNVTPDIDQGLNQGQGLTAEMLEDISEVAASQAMVNHMLSDLSEVDLSEAVETLIRNAKDNPASAFDGIRKMVAEHSARLQEICQVESQLVAQMAHLQEQTVAIRSKPVEVLIRPLEALVETISRRAKKEAKLTAAGGDLTIDVTLMENLRKILRSLITARFNGETAAPNSLHLSFHRDEERVLVTLEDDGGKSERNAIETEELQALLAQSGSDFRQLAVPGGGMRFHISMPLAMVVLEGMVVGVEGVRYVIPVDAIRSIVQPEPDALRRISAGNGQMMLRLEDGPLIGVHNLSKNGVKATSDSEGVTHRRVYVILNAGNRNLAIPVDELLGQQLVLLRPLRGVLRHLKNLTGIALLAGGEVGMVLSTNALSAVEEIAA